MNKSWEWVKLTEKNKRLPSMTHPPGWIQVYAGLPSPWTKSMVKLLACWSKSIEPGHEIVPHAPATNHGTRCCDRFEAIIGIMATPDALCILERGLHQIKTNVSIPLEKGIIWLPVFLTRKIGEGNPVHFTHVEDIHFHPDWFPIALIILCYHCDTLLITSSFLILISSSFFPSSLFPRYTILPFAS